MISEKLFVEVILMNAVLGPRMLHNLEEIGVTCQLGFHCPFKFDEGVQ